MKKINYFFLTTILIGVILEVLSIELGLGLMTIGLLGVLIYYCVDLIKNKFWLTPIGLSGLLRVFIIFASIIIFAKYIHYNFGDYPALIILPIFLYLTLRYFFVSKDKDMQLSITLLIYSLLIIPVLFLYTEGGPRNLIPENSKKIDNMPKIVYMPLPYKYRLNETKMLVQKAHRFQIERKYNDAINLYNQALILEPENPKLFFELSDIYAEQNRIDEAIHLLDKAIIIDGGRTHQLYNNRGSLYYTINEYNKAIVDLEMAIKLDSIHYGPYLNASLCYFYMRDYDMFCFYLNKTKERGGYLPKTIQEAQILYCK